MKATISMRMLFSVVSSLCYCAHFLMMGEKQTLRSWCYGSCSLGSSFIVLQVKLLICLILHFLKSSCGLLAQFCESYILYCGSHGLIHQIVDCVALSVDHGGIHLSP